MVVKIMCHLTGYIGEDNCIPLLLASLEIQEAIIGAQATGLAVMSLGKIIMDKIIGPVKNFKESINFIDESFIGIGHTRYAAKSTNCAETNTKEKAHPFWNSDNSFVTMHNGTIFNYEKLVAELENKGYRFQSKSTYINGKNEKVVDYNDSEVFSYLLEEELKKEGEIKEAIRNACKKIQGHFAFVVIHPEYSERIYIANWMQPMFIGITNSEIFFTSFKEGFKSLEDKPLSQFEPPKNSLMILSKGRIVIEQLLADEKIPEFEPNPKTFRTIILEAIKNNSNDVAKIWEYIQNNSKKIGLSKNDFDELSAVKGYTFSPLIYSYLLKLEEEKVIKRKKEFVWEGGYDKTPRYKFYLTLKSHMK
ncbi:MAG: hypothetical protein JXA54_04830 [Candidatus Heimdallarchaeota archaeon]|nr:hypothetical protein [Candidatus Heimdallarchaeota archaeon]